MRNHFVPRKYQLGFADPNAPGRIWQFDKQTGAFTPGCPLSIRDVGHHRGFYSDDAEQQLANLVEGPANPVLDKLRSGDFALSEEERRTLSVYMATMITRVPRHRARGRQIAPQALTEVTTDVREQVRAAEESGAISSEFARRYFAEIDSAEAKFTDAPPEEVTEIIDQPFARPVMVDLIFRMHWRFVLADWPHHFLTSDNPTFYFECWGLGNENGRSEVTFPFSDSGAIFGSWTPIRRRADRVVRGNQYVKEANSRVAVGAARFIYCRSKEDWVAKIARKGVEHLRRIVW